MGKILDFLFGKSPKIFDKDGNVRHDLGQKKWDDWNKRYHDGAEYNWRNHTGMKGGESSAKKDKRP
jgi:hypothetical protein